MSILVLELLGSIAIILLSCEIFANSVEHVGNKLGMSHAAAGSLLAAVGTAMPETMIPILALIFGRGHAGEEIGIGAILGAPFMLCTLAFFLLGLTMQILHWRGKRNSLTMNVDLKAMTFELKFFVPIISFVFLVSLVGNRTLNLISGGILVLLYVFYVKASLKHEGVEGEEYCEHFYFGKYLRMPCTGIPIALQLIAGLGGIILGARIFVDSISNLSTALGFSALIMSLLIAPVATELPEKYNSITWTIRRQDTLALANVTGAMVFQSMIPVAIGLFLTDWKLGTTEMLNISFALLSSVLVLATMLIKKKLPSQVLLVGGLFYVSYLVYVFFLR
jgi:cation:H+ antiporter